ncbi:serine/threonine-protein kinase [Haloimpatiens massiliensis]|uniref:serine/threonine-protein kinase n=2 Tax=Clostridiaceae TaxID=31979 RepID=UPI000C8411B1|nr:serine/threonine-protein kinase [Haloimpatiens massiliensis]
MSEYKGKIIDGRYKLIEILGKGGMSVVYKAVSINFEKNWAVKEITLNKNADIDFLAEPNILKNLDHPALPRIVDIINEEEKIYIVLDYIDGTSLNILLNQCISFPEEKVISWAKELCDVLKYLHNQKPNPIIYRDMKPGNIMLNKEGKIKLIDFGIAREYKKDTASDTVIIGTRGYAAPEQYGNHQTDNRTDIYSLGVTLYHLLTGQGPNDPPYELVPVRTINPKYSEGIEHIISKCIQQDPINRYQNIEELIYDLNNIEKLSYSYKIKKRRSKGKYFIAALCIGVAITVFGVFKINNLKNNDYMSLLTKGEQYQEAKQYDDALRVFNSAIDNLPDKDEGYLAVANLYYAQSDFDKMLKYLKVEAVSERPELIQNDKYNYFLGLACFSKANYKEAISCFEKVKDKKFEGVNYYYAISKSLNKPGKLTKDDEAIKNVDELIKYIETIENEEKRLRGYIMIADIYRDNFMILDEDYNKQIDLLEKINSQSKDKGNTAIYERLGAAYNAKAMLSDNEAERKKYYNKSLENYLMVKKLGTDTMTLYSSLGNVELQLRNFDEAEKYFKVLINKYPNNSIGYAKLAKLFYLKQMTKDKEQRDFSDFFKNYKLAEKYSTTQSSNDIQALKQIYKELQNQGYVK